MRKQHRHDLKVGPWSTLQSALTGMTTAMKAYAKEIGGVAEGQVFNIHRHAPRQYGATGEIMLSRVPRKYTYVKAGMKE